MKLSSLLTLACAFVCAALLLPASALHAADTEADGQPQGVVIDPQNGALSPGQVLTITFPTAMVKEDDIDADGHDAPFVSEPRLPGKFVWKSQTEGKFTVGEKLTPGSKYHLSLDPALKDLDGKEVKVAKWSADFTTAEFGFSIRSDEDDSDNSDDSDSKKTKPQRKESEHIDSQQQVWLNATWPVSYQEAAEHIFFQDRDSLQRYPVDIMLSDDNEDDENDHKTESGTSFGVEPRDPLPVERSFDLVIEGIHDLNAGQPLKYPQAFPVGPTHALKVNWVEGRNFSTDKPCIAVKFDDKVDQDDVNPEMFKIEPEVKNLKFDAGDDEVDITGDFDIHTHYTITILPTFKGERGYGVAKDSRWGVTFKPKPADVLFPSDEVFERAGMGLHFAFFQVNSPKVTWTLAPIPPEKLAAVAARVKEFTQNATDPYSGQTITKPDSDIPAPHKTELLVDAFGLQTAGSGEFDATDGDKQVLREIEWQPARGKKLSGAYLLEVSGAGGDGRVVGNRTIVSFSDVILTLKRTDTAVALRVAKMSDGMPVPGVTVHVVTRSNTELDSATTDENGIVSFPGQLFAGYINGDFLGDSTPQDVNKNLAFTLIADTADGPALQFLDLATFNSGAPIYTQPGVIAKKQDQELRSVIVTDRNLYRPLQTVQMKGMLRIAAVNGALTIPAGAQAHWRITGADDDHTVVEGDAPVSADGGWTAHWDIPEKIQLTDYAIHCQYGDLKTDDTTEFGIQEYRVPLFTAEVAILNKAGSSSQVKVTSAYFHGAPNRGARVHWTATWTTADGNDDRYSDESAADGDGNNDQAKFTRYDSDTGRNDTGKPAREPEDAKTVEGDATLDANGVATIKCDAPFTDGVTRGRCTVVWKADITSIDGQTITGGDSVTLQFVPALPGIRATEQPDEQSDQHGVKVEVDAVDVDDKPVAGLQMDVDLYHLTTKSVKEKLAPLVYRYRNTTTYTKVASHTLTAPGSFVFPVDDTGDYNAVATTKNQDHTPIVSDDATVSGEEPAEFPVENEASFKITHEDKKFEPGENAVLHVEAPFAGVAWVSVESNEILTTKLVKLDGNSGRIELPIKKEYGPNVFVSVYLVKPGGADELPKERFAFTNINVNVPEQELHIATKIEKETVRPGDIVRGEITVTSGNPDYKPGPVNINTGTLSFPQVVVPSADIAVFAVDDAVLKLGDWKLPDPAATFYPERRFGVSTYTALARYITGIKRDSITEKGFVIGDGGEDAFKNVTVVREEFRTLAYWEGSLKTDAQGKIKFEFKAPDNLTSYRIVAMGETDKNQFGGDASCVVKISKTLIAEPALPRFVRNGDELELRLVVREKCASTDQVAVRCVPDGHLQLIGPAEATQEATNDVPVVYRFRAKVVDPDFTATTVRFDAASKTNTEATDSVQNTIPCFPPVTVRVESRAGTFDGPNFDTAQKMPDTWKNAHGTYNLTISTSQYLPKINGLPEILDYPHGCFDQISTRMLGYGALGDLLAYLPNAESREKNYRDSIQNGLKQFGDSVHEDGMLPYWPEEEKPSPYCTVEACWALGEIQNAGFKIPEKLPDKIAKATKEIALGHVKSEPFTQALALMVLSQKHADGDFATVVQDLYLKRNNSDDETRALLALTMHQLNIMPQEKAQLMREIDNGDILAKAFDPKTFSTATRAEAVRALAFCKIAPENWTPDKKNSLRKKMLALMDSSTDLSTQENLWLLLAFKAFQDSENVPKLELPKDTKAALSLNGDSAGWQGLPIPPGVNKALSGLNNAQLSYIISGKYMSDNAAVDREDRGIRVERVVRNLTDPKRTGTAEAPFKLGDQILITYRMFTQKPQDYVALEDELPAGLETMNFNLPQVGKFYPEVIAETKEPPLDLSHSELRDQASMLYFDQIPSGPSNYGILARAAVAGTFRWPATQVEPMYDSRFSGLSPSSLCVVASGD